MAQVPRALTYQGIPLWRHVVVIQWTLQIISAVVILSLVFWFLANIGGAIAERDIPYGFGFLNRAYQTPIGEHFLPYDPTDPYWYALLVAFTNTALLALVGIILAIALGIVIGVARISDNFIVSRAAMVYVEFFRNVPLLVQILFWFYIVLTLPILAESYVVADVVFINNAGVSFPWPTPTGGAIPALLWLASIGGAVFVGMAVHRYRTRRELLTGRVSYPLAFGIGAAIAVVVAAWIVISLTWGSAPFTVTVPGPEGRFGRIEHGLTLRSGALVLLISLVIYTASFIAEIVRAGLQSVGRGQIEAARAMGLSPMDTLRTVTFPQALRVIIPPLISQCLNLTKNSSLAAAIGYADLTNVAITMTQTAPAISIFLLIMVAYLVLSLTWSLIGNLYNWRIRYAGT